jgi:competence protein ComEA
VNTADVMALTSLKGVGEKKAQAIIAYRKKNGPFSSMAEFEAVPGVGPSIIEKNKNQIVFR